LENGSIGDVTMELKTLIRILGVDKLFDKKEGM